MAFIKVATLAGKLAFLIPAYLLMVIVGGTYVNRYTKRTSDRVAAASSVVSQCLSNVALIQALGAESRLETKLAQILGQAQKEGLKRAVLAALQFGSLFIIAYSANALAFWQGSMDIADTVEGNANGVTAGAMYTVIFLLVDGKSCLFCCYQLPLMKPSIACGESGRAYYRSLGALLPPLGFCRLPLIDLPLLTVQSANSINSLPLRSKGLSSFERSALSIHLGPT